MKMAWVVFRISDDDVRYGHKAPEIDSVWSEESKALARMGEITTKPFWLAHVKAYPLDPEPT